MIELVLRLAFSLAVVLGLLTLLARVSAKRFRGSTDAPIRVVHRQALSRGSAVAVVSVGSRVLVVGSTEQQVSLLTELDPDELPGLDIPQASGAEADFEAELEAVLDAGLDSTEPAVPATPPAVRTAGAHKRTRSLVAGAPGQGALAGSALSPQTWRQAFAVATRREQAAS